MLKLVCFSSSAMKSDRSKFPNFRKWLMASIERPKAKVAVALRG